MAPEMEKIAYNKRPGMKGLDEGIRKVSPSYGRTVNFVQSDKKAEQTFAVDGQGERIVAHALSLDPGVSQFQSQSLTIDLIEGCLLWTPEQRREARRKYKDVGGRCLYTPDFLARIADGKGNVLEVKLDRFVGDDEYEKTLAIASVILVTNGYTFERIVLPSIQTHAVWSNIPLVSQAARRKELYPSQVMVARIEELFNQGAKQARDFLAPLGIGMNMVPVLVAAGAMAVDLLLQPIRGDSPVQASYGGLDHLRVLQRLVK